MLRLPPTAGKTSGQSEWNFQKTRWQSLFFLLSPPNEIPPTAAPMGPEKNQAQRQEIKSMNKPPQIMIMNSLNINVHSYY